MRNLLTAFAILLFGILLAITIGNSKPKPEKIAEQAPEPVTVNTISANAISTGVKVSTHGKIEAAIAIDVTAEVSGQIIWVSPKFIQGGNFKKGETLLKIDPTQYEAELAEAKARITQAEELVKTEKARANQAKKEWRDLGTEEANDLFLRNPQIANANAQLNAAQAGLKRAKNALSKASVLLPFDSHITTTMANIGQFVLLGNKLATAYAENDMQVMLPISQKQLEVLNITWPVKASQLPSVELTGKIGGSTANWTGNIVSNSANFDEKNQLLHFLVKLESSEIKALPGQYVEASIYSKHQNNVFYIPEDAFHDKRFLLAINSDDNIDFIPAQFLSREGKNIFVRSNISEGTTIIIDRMPLATAGMPVTPKE